MKFTSGLVFCVSFFIWKGTISFFSGGGAVEGGGFAYESPYLNWSKMIQHSIIGNTFLGSVAPFSQIRFHRVQTFHSVLSNMFPCATDHDAGTYYPHFKKKRRFEVRPMKHEFFRR